MLFVWLNVGFTKVVIYSFIYLLEAYSPVNRRGSLNSGLSLRYYAWYRRDCKVSPTEDRHGGLVVKASAS